MYSFQRPNTFFIDFQIQCTCYCITMFNGDNMLTLTKAATKTAFLTIGTTRLLNSRESWKDTDSANINVRLPDFMTL